MMSDYHIPVLLNDVIEGLAIKPQGVYVDVTFGGGGHSVEILKKLETGKLFAFDQDQDAAENVIDDERFIFSRQNFSLFGNMLQFHKVDKVDGILADLGVSSHQFDVADRGFSFRFEGPLDMRMNQNAAITAANILNDYEESEIADVLYQYGEFRESRKIARAICRDRESAPFETTHGLSTWFDDHFGRITGSAKARLFQALRIEVNKEMEVLEKFLETCGEVIAPGGRLVVISYHSLEDRIVKNYINKGNVKGEVVKDFYGNIETVFKPVNRKVIVPTEEEIERNPRARSAKMRIGERV